MTEETKPIGYQPPLQKQEHFFFGHCYGRMQFGQHWHFEMEVLYCIKGEIQIQIADQIFNAQPGEFLIVGSCTPHSFLGLTDDTESVTLEFGSSLLGENYHQMIQYLFPVHSANSHIGAILSSMYALIDKTELADRLLLKGYLFTLASVMIEELGVLNPSRFSISSTLRQAEGVNRVLVHMTDGYRGSLTLGDAAGIAGYEKKNFCRVFKQIMGVSFHQYLNTYRIEQACQLFRSGESAIGEVGKLCGIPEAKTFSRLFRQHTGMTPTEFIQTFCQKNIISTKAEGEI